MPYYNPTPNDDGLTFPLAIEVGLPFRLRSGGFQPPRKIFVGDK